MKSPWRRQRLSPSRPHVYADKCCPLAVSNVDFCAPNIVAFSVLAPRMEEPVRSVFEVSRFSTCACDQNIGWPHRDDDLSNGPILDHARRKPDDKWAGDACAVRETARREHIKKSFDSSIPCFSRQEDNDLRMLSGFEVFAKCSVARARK